MKYEIVKTDQYLLIVDDTMIIAHLPLGDSEVMEKVPLLPPLEVEDDVENLAERSSELQEGTYTIQHKVTYKHGFIDGYNKAKENKYTEEDIYKAMRFGGMRSKVSIQELDDAFQSLIQSLSQPKITHFECEIDRKCWCMKPMSGGCSECSTNSKTTTNSQGQTVWVGKYV